MTPQNVIKKFVARLVDHGYTASDSEAMSDLEGGIFLPVLDSAIRASSRYTSVYEILESMYVNHIKSEKNAIQIVVTECFGLETFNNYCVEDDNIKSLSEISNEILDRSLSEIDNEILAITYGEEYTVKDLIQEMTALIFLTDCCGIDLNNEDTGAITGSDANLVLSADMFGDRGIQMLQTLKSRYGDESELSSDGQTIVIGTGVTKNADDIVPENFNTYNADTSTAQTIITNKRGWVVNATNFNDTVTSNGADYINAGAGDDLLTVRSNNATLNTGAGKDIIVLTADIKEVTINDLAAEDTLMINGTFDLGSAQIEDMQLVITDKTGTRKITLGEFQKNTKIRVNAATTTLGKWLANTGITLGNASIPSGNTSNSSSASVKVNFDSIESDDAGNVWFDDKFVGELSNSYPNVSTFTKNGLTIHLRGESSDISLSQITPLTFDQLNSDQKTIIAGLFKWWAEEAINLNEESYGLGFGDNVNVRDVDLYFFNSQTGSYAAILSDSRIDFDGSAIGLYLTINTEPYQNISPDNVNGNTNGYDYLDRTLAHEFNHAILTTNISYFSKLPTFIKEGIAELTHGVDDDLQDLIMDVARDRDKLLLELDIGNDDRNNVSNDTYAAGYVFFRYFARQAALQTLYIPAFGEIETVTVNFNNLDVALGNILYVDTSKTNPTVQVAEDLDTFNNLEDPNEVLLAIGEIANLDDGTLYYFVYNDLVKQSITLGGQITNVYQLNANTDLTGSEGDDAIQIAEGSNSINGSAGNDYLEITGQYASINTGAGDDLIILYDGGHNNINLGDGNNYIELGGEPFQDNSQDYIYSYLYNNTITGGSGNDTVLNPKIRYFDDYGYEVPDDQAEELNAIGCEFYGYQFYSNVDLGDGDNYVSFTSMVDSSIKTGKDSDIIAVTVLKNSTVNAGEGDDGISFSGNGNVISGGAGNNIIMNESGHDNTIKTAAGANSISIGAAVDSFTVEGFSEDDMIIFVNAPNGLGIEDEKLVAGKTTITGINSLADVEENWSTTSNKITYKQEIYGGAFLYDNTLLYIPSSKENLFTITGLKSAEGVSIDGSDVIITQEALKNRSGNTISISGGDYNLKLDGAIDGTLMISEGAQATFKNGTYTAAINDESYTESNGVITYHAGTGGQQFTITGLKTDAKLDRDIFVGDGGKVTVKASALPSNVSEGTTVVLTDSNSKDGVNYTLTFDTDIAQDSSLHKDGWTGSNGTFTFTEDYKVAHWAKNNNTYTYHNSTGGHKFRISGLDSTLTADKLTSKTIAVSGNATSGYTVKFLSADILPKTGSVSVTGVTGINNVAAANCSLAMDSKIATPKDIAESLVLKSGKYNYTSAGKTAGWSLVNGKIVYSAQVGGDTFTLSGLKSGVKLNNGIAVNGNVVTVSANALNANEKNGANIVLADTNGKYSLKLDSAILQSSNQITGAFTDISNGKATYTATHNLSYYEPTASNTFTYRKQDAAKKIVIGNLKKTATTSDLDAIKITEADGKFNVAFNNDKILDNKTPSISVDKGVTYTVTVADALNPVLLDADWLVKSTNASLKSDTSAGYVLKNGKIIYVAKQTGKPQMILSGLNSNASLDTPVNDTLTLKATDLGKNSYLKANAAQYAVELTGDMTGKKFYGTGGNDTLKVSSSNGAVDGGNGDDDFTIAGNSVSVLGGAGNDAFKVTGEGVTVMGGKGADTLNVSNKDAVLAYNKGDGLDTVNYAQGLKVSLGGTMTPSNVAQDSRNMIINLGKNDSITVTNMGDTLEVRNAKTSQTIAKSNLTLESNLTFDAKSTAVTIGSAFKGTISPADDVYMSGGKMSKVSTIDAGAVTGNASIVGNAKANTIIGGKNSTLTGGAGNDLFIYSGGKITITDYGVGSDKISLGSAYDTYSVNGNDVILGMGRNNSVTVADRVGKAITLVEGKTSTVNVYNEDGTFNSGMTSATLSGSSFDATAYSKLVTISAADSSRAVNIIGNAKANVIVGGNSNDTFTGGAGKDTFICGKGANVIMDYAAEDKISLDLGVSLTDVSVSGQDATLKLSDGGTLKLVGVGDKKVTVVESSINAKGKKVSTSATYVFEDRWLFNSGKTAVTLTGANGDLSDKTVATITAGDTFSGKSITGNDKANNINGSDKGESILGGNANDKLYGNGSADTLWGGAGNDILYGGEGVDTFIYKPGDGKDTIMDYESGELLTIMDSTFKSSSFSKNILTLAIDNGSVTFKNVTSTTDFNINGTTYKVNGKTLA